MTTCTDEIASVLRMKGHMWQGNSHDLIGYISTAGNVSRIDSSGRWNFLEQNAWKVGDEDKEKHRTNWVGDRRQELVFIVQDLKHRNFQEILDEYLVIDKMMTLGVDRWKATIGDIMLES